LKSFIMFIYKQLTGTLGYLLSILGVFLLLGGPLDGYWIMSAVGLVMFVVGVLINTKYR